VNLSSELVKRIIFVVMHFNILSIVLIGLTISSVPSSGWKTPDVQNKEPNPSTVNSDYCKSAKPECHKDHPEYQVDSFHSANAKNTGTNPCNEQSTSGWFTTVGAVVGGAALAAGAVVAAPVVVAGLGFTSAGIAAGSAAASMMSAYGGSVAAGSAVAVLQSIGAAGMGAVATGVVATGGGVVGAAAGAAAASRMDAADDRK
jgi:hypothetical protein